MQAVSTRDRPDAVVVAGAGGFIGGHLVARLLADGAVVRAVDVRQLAAEGIEQTYRWVYDQITAAGHLPG